MSYQLIVPQSAFLSVSGITIRSGNWNIVQDISFEALRGKVTALLGPNGAGKTTLLRGILGLEPLSAGRVTIESEPNHPPFIADLHTLPEIERARLTAYVPQHSRLSARLSARAMVELGRFPHRGNNFSLGERDHSIVLQALVDTDCSYLEKRSFSDCSGGEQARLLVARALATEAPFLFLDEPAANLDIYHSLDLFHLLRRLADSGKAVVIVLHQLEQALRWADKALIIDASRAVAWGPCHEVLTPQRIEEVYGVYMIPNSAPSYERLQQIDSIEKREEKT